MVVKLLSFVQSLPSSYTDLVGSTSPVSTKGRGSGVPGVGTDYPPKSLHVSTSPLARTDSFILDVSPHASVPSAHRPPTFPPAPGLKLRTLKSASSNPKYIYRCMYRCPSPR